MRKCIICGYELTDGQAKCPRCGFEDNSFSASPQQFELWIETVVKTYEEQYIQKETRYWFFRGQDYVKQGKYKQALNCFKEDESSGNADTLYMIGFCYQYGEEISDPEEAMRYYAKASNMGHVDAQYQLAGYYEDGIDVKKDKLKAFKLYSDAYANGCEKAKSKLSLAPIMNELFSLFITIIAIFLGVVFCSWVGAKLLEFILSLYGIVI